MLSQQNWATLQVLKGILGKPIKKQGIAHLHIGTLRRILWCNPFGLDGTEEYEIRLLHVDVTRIKRCSLIYRIVWINCLS